MAELPEPITEYLPRTLEKLSVETKGVNAVQVGDNCNLVVVSSSAKGVRISDENANETETGEELIDGSVIISQGNIIKLRYVIKQGETTFISIGDKCNMLEIILSEELNDKLKEARQIKFSSGDDLVSVMWISDNLDHDTITTELKIQFINESSDTSQLEREIFTKIQGNDSLIQLITQLFNTFNAKLKHIKAGCIQLILSFNSQEDVQIFQQHRDIVMRLLHQTIIPESTDIQITYTNPKPSKQGSGEQVNEDSQKIVKEKSSRIQSIVLPPYIIETIHDKTTKDEPLSRAGSLRLPEIAKITPDENILEVQSIRRKVGATPSKQGSGEQKNEDSPKVVIEKSSRIQSIILPPHIIETIHDTTIKDEPLSRTGSLRLQEIAKKIPDENILEVQSIRRKVGATPGMELQTDIVVPMCIQRVEDSEIDEMKFGPYKLIDRTPITSRGLFRESSESIEPTRTKEYVKVSPSAPIGFEGISQTTKAGMLWELKDMARSFMVKYPKSDFSLGKQYKLALNMLLSQNFVIIHGNRGSGKSTFASNLVIDMHSMDDYKVYEPVLLTSPEQLGTLTESPTPKCLLVDDMDGDASTHNLMYWGYEIESLISSSNFPIKCVFVTNSLPPPECTMYSLFKTRQMVNLNDTQFSENIACKLNDKYFHQPLDLNTDLVKTFIGKTVIDGSLGAAVVLNLSRQYLGKWENMIRNPFECIAQVLDEYEKENIEGYVALIDLALSAGYIYKSSESDYEHQLVLDLVNSVYLTKLSLPNVILILSKETSIFIELKEDTNTFGFTHNIVKDAVLERFASRNMDILIENCSHAILRQLVPESSHAKRFYQKIVFLEHYPLIVNRVLRDTGDDKLDECYKQFLLDNTFFQMLLKELTVKQFLLMRLTNGQYLLHFLILYGSIEIFQTLLRSTKVEELNTKDVVHFSTESPFDSAQKVHMIVQHGRFIDHLMNTNIHGNTPLHIAAFWDQDKTLEILLKNAPEPQDVCKILNNENETPLQVSVKRGNVASVKVLLDYGVDVNLGVQSGKPINIAADRFDQPIIKILLNAGADVNDITQETRNKLENKYQFDILKTIDFRYKESSVVPLEPIQRGASSLDSFTHGFIRSDTYSHESLHMAIMHNADESEVRRLILNMDSVNIKNENGETALHLAVQYDNLAAVKLLLDNGASCNCENNNFDLPLHMSCLSHRADITRLLISHDSATHVKNIDGNTPLHLAIRYSGDVTVKLLLEATQHKNYCNKEGNTPLHIAVMYGNIGATDLLVNAGVCTNVKNEKQETPLIIAVKNDKADDVSKLLEGAADVNTSDSNGDTPLHIAAKKENLNMTRLLLDHPDIDVHIVNMQRYTAAYDTRGEIRLLLTQRGCSTSRTSKCAMM